MEREREGDRQKEVGFQTLLKQTGSNMSQILREGGGEGNEKERDTRPQKMGFPA